MNILIIEDVIKPGYYDIIYNHMVENYCELTIRKTKINDNIASRVPNDWPDLIVWWLQDPLYTRQTEYELATEMWDYYNDGRNIPNINPPHVLPNTAKSVAASIIKEAGFRTPRMYNMARGEMPPKYFPYPYFVRENSTHGQHMYRVMGPQDLDDISIQYGITHNVRDPVAVEYIDTFVDDRYVKYRMVVTGNLIHPLHVQCSKDWITRGINRIQDDVAEALERNFTSSTLGNYIFYASRFIKAAKLLNFDFCAFDYGYKDDEIVIWEVNTYPLLHYIKPKNNYHRYRNDVMRRCLDAIVQMYIRKANHGTSNGQSLAM